MANLLDPAWDDELDRPPFTWRRARLGRQAGARALGASLFELPAGASNAPLHLHHGNEELIVVVSGRPTLRGLDSEEQLEPGQMVACLPGRIGAHRLDNRAEEPARVLIVSTMCSPEIIEYPDSGKIVARNSPPGGEPPDEPFAALTRPDPDLDYFDGET